MHGSKFLISYSSENQIDMFDKVLSKKKEQLLSIREDLHSQATQIEKLAQYVLINSTMQCNVVSAGILKYVLKAK
jgi:hypothetical protein